MRRRLTTAASGLILLTASLSACGGDSEQASSDETSPPAATQTSDPTASRTPATAPTPAPTQEQATAETLSPDDFAQVTSPEWTAIAADPEFHKGQRYVLFGRITDAAQFTGSEGLMLTMDVGPVSASLADGYPTAAVGSTDFALDEDVTTITNFVMYVEMTGTYNLSSEGGSEHAPSFKILRMSEV